MQDSGGDPMHRCVLIDSVNRTILDLGAFLTGFLDACVIFHAIDPIAHLIFIQIETLIFILNLRYEPDTLIFIFFLGRL